MDKFVKYFLVLPLFLIFISYLVIAADIPGDWKGYVTINSSTTPDGTIVEAYIGGVSTNNASVGAIASEYYLIHVDGNAGDSVSFLVCGINASPTNVTPETWSVGPHPYQGSPFFNLTITQLANGAACSYDCACTSSLCYNSACAASTTSTSTTTTAATTAGGGGGGGGAAATTTVATTTVGTTTAATTVATTTAVTTTIAVEETSTVTGTIATGTSDTFTYVKDVGITDITVDVKNTVSNPKITIKAMDVTKEECEGTTAKISAPGVSYKGLCFEKENIQSEDMTSVKIKFKVSNVWIFDNDIDEDTIALYRYEGGSWTKIPTTKIGKDSNYIYFGATVSELSLFAISGEKEEVPIVKPPEVDWSMIIEIIKIIMMLILIIGIIYLAREIKKSRPGIKRYGFKSR